MIVLIEIVCLLLQCALIIYLNIQARAFLFSLKLLKYESCLLHGRRAVAQLTGAIRYTKTMPENELTTDTPIYKLGMSFKTSAVVGYCHI